MVVRFGLRTMREDTSTAHEKAILVSKLSRDDPYVKKHGIGVLYTHEAAKYDRFGKGVVGVYSARLQMKAGKFYITTRWDQPAEVSQEVFADGSFSGLFQAISESKWWYDTIFSDEVAKRDAYLLDKTET